MAPSYSSYTMYANSGGATSPLVHDSRNVYVNLLGHICRLPFDAKRNGLWHFDGQVFYQRKASKELK